MGTRVQMMQTTRTDTGSGLGLGMTDLVKAWSGWVRLPWAVTRCACSSTTGAAGDATCSEPATRAVTLMTFRVPSPSKASLSKADEFGGTTTSLESSRTVTSVSVPAWLHPRFHTALTCDRVDAAYPA